MATLYTQSAPKKATNLSINSDLLKKARGMNINLSATLETALAEKLSQDESEKWKQENKMAMESYNEFVDKNGNFSDEFRVF